ncbi:MAG: helix-turn-helix domain-containing protein [Candidatus Dadabacteria bacterium]|nr:helix-turn-helix domain-containing protein [Candidatus Dadabacteria bacterium]
MQNDELIEELESLKRTLQNSVEALKNRDRKITFLNKEIDELKKYPESLKENINTIEDKQISLVNLEITRPIKKKLPYEISGRKIMTVKQLAKKLDIVEDTVYVWVKNNKLPCEKSKNGRLKFIKDNINDWLMKINKGEYSVRKTI